MTLQGLLCELETKWLCILNFLGTSFLIALPCFLKGKKGIEKQHESKVKAR